jgi:peptidoglycan/LPS O-acetylase OafA/YrhL
MFFALSGFLIAGSLFRCRTLITFMGLRAIRIVPALAVEIVLCAFILGPIFTRLNLHEYFSDRLFYRYFFNIIGHVQFVLPGVFGSNPHPNVVNEQLWTIPWELRCYLLIAGMWLVALLRNRVFLVTSALAFSAAALCYYAVYPPATWVSVHGVVLVESFLAGIVLFVFREKLAHRSSLFVASLVATVALLLTPHGDYLISFPAAYVIIYLGLLNPPRNRLLLSGDYSYGIYLYGFPIQQAVAYINGAHRSWFLDALYVVPLTLTVAIASWWCVEKPALGLRKYLKRTEEWYLLRGSDGEAAAVEVSAND